MSAGVEWLRKQYPQYADLPDSTLLAGFQKKFYPDMDAITFRSALEKKAGQSTPVAASPFTPQSSLGASGAQLGGPQRGGLYDQAATMIPPTLGAVGGLLGGLYGGPPGAILGAAGGGMAGEGLRRAVTGQPQSLGGNLGQGAIQGGSEALGLGIAAGMRGAARPILSNAVRAGKSVLSKFPGALDVIAANRLLPNAAGAAEADALRQAAVGDVAALRAKAAASGTSFLPGQVTPEAEGLLTGTRLDDAEKAIAARHINRFKRLFSTPGTPAQTSPVLNAQGNPIVTPGTPPQEVPMSPDELKIWKQKFQNRGGLNASPSRPVIASPTAQLVNRKLAVGAQRSLETIPGMAEAEGKVQGLMGAQQALEAAAMRPPYRWIFPAAVGGAAGAVAHGAPGGLLGAGMLMAADNPTVQARLSYILADPFYQAVARQSPRAAAALLDALGYTPQPVGAGQ